MSLNPLLKLVKTMHKKFGISYQTVPFSAEEKEFRIKAMREEIQEYEDTDNKVDELDALVDLIVFALGTAERQGFLYVFEEAFKRVMVANTAKEIGTNAKRGNFALDLIKPKGWTPADLTDLVPEVTQPCLIDSIGRKKKGK